MGLPEILIELKKQGTSAIERSARGIVALVLKDDTKNFDTKIYKSLTEVATEDWTADNKDYIEKTFMGTPSMVIVERIATTDTDYTNGLDRLRNKKWNYLAIPGIEAGDVTNVISWIKTERDVNKKTYKVVLPDAVADHEGVINFTTNDIKVGEKTYSASKYTCRIAGILAGLSLTRSATYYELNEVEGITESTDPNADIDNGQLILINDGTKIKIGRGVNSLTTTTENKTEEFKKIKIIDAVDFIRDDIRDIFDDAYVGKVINSYDNKILFLSAVNAYLGELERLGVLDDAYDNKAEINLETQRLYLQSKGVNIDALKEQEVKEYNSGSKLFAKAQVRFLDAMEDLQMEIFI